ncbi:MAG TPA: HRDC domain-containing protein [Planctomycetota bacterium]
MPSRVPKDWPPVRIIEDVASLHNAIGEWSGAGVIGVDTESNSFYAYEDRLCLLQVSTDVQDYIVDPVALGAELKAINPLLADPGLVKVLHSAEFDLMLLRKDLGAEMRGMFDTQVAMTLLQTGKTGLAALLESRYGLQLSKKEQRSDWGRRPLTEQQLAYARIDTHFLPDLYRTLHAELAKSDRLEAATGEFRRLELEVLPPREIDLEGWRRLKGAKRMQGEPLARVRALFQWREQTAQAADQPPFRVMANEVLIDLAERPPADVKEIASRRGFGWPRARKIGDEVLEAIKGASAADVEVFHTGRPDKAEIRRRKLRRENQDALRQWRKRLAASMDLPSERLLHRRHLEEVGRSLPRTAEELNKLVPLNDWQRENLETSLLEMLAGLQDPETID